MARVNILKFQPMEFSDESVHGGHVRLYENDPAEYRAGSYNPERMVHFRIRDERIRRFAIRDGNNMNIENLVPGDDITRQIFEYMDQLVSENRQLRSRQRI